MLNKVSQVAKGLARSIRQTIRCRRGMHLPLVVKTYQWDVKVLGPDPGESPTILQTLECPHCGKFQELLS